MPDKINLSELIGRSSSFDFSISEKMVMDFARLTGDFSSLHVDKTFGRKSFYRRNVVHGMLLVSHIILCDLFNELGGFYLTKISGKFLKAAFPGDILSFSSEIVKIDESQSMLEFKFQVANKKNGNLLCKGKAGISFTGIAQKNISRIDNPNLSMLVSGLKESVKSYEELNEGDKENFSFKIDESHLQNLRSILIDGNKNLETSGDRQIKNFTSFTNLLSANLLSTYVGMIAPGQNATFLDFDINFNQPLLAGALFDMNGEIGMKSDVANAIILDIAISKGNEIFAIGRVTAKVNEPSLPMPTIEEIKKSDHKIDLHDKVVLITGASRGNGEVTAKLFGIYGAKVAVNYFRSKDDAERVVNEINADGGNAFSVQADVRSTEDVKRMISEINEKFGNVEILVNNAVGDYLPINFLESSWDDISEEIDVSVKGAYNCIKEVLPSMIKKKSGKIINLSTVAVENPPPKQTKYVVAKSALNGLTRSLAVDFAAHNIQINLVVPGLVETDLTKYISKAIKDEIIEQTPMKRNASPVEVAKAIIYLASSFSSFTTGQKIMVTGGMPPFL